MATKMPVNDADLLGRSDQGFTFPLPTRVEGMNAKAREFFEDTVLTYISHQGSAFILKNPLQIGARLKIIVDLPEKMAEDTSLKLVIRGRVVKVEALRPGHEGHRVTVRFDSKYIIKPEA